MNAPIPHKSKSRLKLSLDDIDLFSRASHDANPLHMSADYARRTPFGARVAHGMLAVLACAGQLRERSGERLGQIQIAFNNPVFADTPYDVSVEEEERRATIRLMDGRRTLLSATLAFAEGTPSALAPTPMPAPRSDARRLAFAEVEPGSESAGAYGPSAHLGALLDRFQVASKTGVGPVEATLLLAASYLVGMEAPGEASLFSHATIDLDARAAGDVAEIAYRLSITDRNDKFDLVRMKASFTSRGASVAEAELEAFVRGSASTVDVTGLRTLSAPSSALAGVTALVVGASRGLGAAIALALADQGCVVGLAFAKSRDAAERVAASAPPGSIELLQVDAEDATQFAPAARAFATRHGGLDILVCNACPPLAPLALDVAASPRIVDYVARSMAMTAVPLTSTLDLLKARAGSVVLVSSIAVTAPPGEWPHYVAAKAAVEALIGVVRASTPNVRAIVVRPPRLRTDFVSTLGAVSHAMAPEIVAARIVEQLIKREAAGLTLLDTFGAGA